PHHHMRNHVDPQSRRLALADAAIEQLDLLGHLRKQGIERVVQDFEPRHFRVAQVDDNTGAIGRLDPRLVKRVAQANRSRLARRIAASHWRLGHRNRLTSSNSGSFNLSATTARAKAVCFQYLSRMTDGPTRLNRMRPSVLGRWFGEHDPLGIIAPTTRRSVLTQRCDWALRRSRSEPRPCGGSLPILRASNLPLPCGS